MASAKQEKQAVLAVLGGGQWGPHLIRNFNDHRFSRVKTVVEPRAERRSALAERFPGVDFLSDPTQVFSDQSIDAVVISTPTSSHFDLVRAALDAGKHVFVEKPITDSVTHARELCESADQSNLILMVGHVFLFNPAITAAKSLIDQGDLGELYYGSMLRTNLGPVRTDVSAAWDLASHDVSIANYWLGTKPLAVSSRGGSWLNEGIDDAVFATLEYPSGVLIHIHASWLSPRKSRFMTLVGSRKMLTVNDMDLSEPLRIYDKGIEDGPQEVHDTFASFRANIRDGAITIPNVSLGEPLARRVRRVRGQAPRKEGSDFRRVGGFGSGASTGGDVVVGPTQRSSGQSRRGRMKQIPLVDLGRQLEQIRAEVEEGWATVLAESNFILGSPVADFEKAFARFCETRFCLGVANGTDAIELVLRASGIGPGDEVLIPANTFIATALAVLRAGADVRLVDADPRDLPHWTKQPFWSAELRNTSRDSGPSFGQIAPCDQLADQADLVLIEDAAQAQGARRYGRSIGSFGIAAATSFFPGKNLGAFGDAGAILTNDPDLATKLTALRNWGSTEKYHHPEVGFNSRLDTLQAVVLSAKLSRLAQWNEETGEGRLFLRPDDRRASQAARDASRERSCIPPVRDRGR